MASITIRNVNKSFDNTMVLKDFNETIADGEFVTLLGPSGCGKTTMLRMIAGFERPDTGEILIGDKVVSSGKTFLPPEKRGIGMVFQSYAVWPHMTVFDNVAYPLTVQKLKKDAIRQEVERVLEIVHLTQYAERVPSQLSGGQQQRVALARALVARPQVLLLDEPLSNLDAKLRESMRFEIKEIQTRLGITVIYVTHDQAEAMAMSDRIVLINDGVVQQSASPAELYDHPINQFAADFLGKVVFLKGEIRDGRIHPDGTDQTLRYDGNRQGRIELALRPERISLSTESGELEGVMVSRFYLGDVSDCRVRVGSVDFRVIAPPETFYRLNPGDRVFLTLREKLLFDEDGSLEDKLRIRT